MTHCVTPTAMVGIRVREIRRRRDWTAQDVADRCAEAGRPELNRSIIANLENGRRASLTIEELLVLAHVLHVPPVLLMTPVGTEDHLQITPDLAYPPIQALTWITGESIASRASTHDVAPIRLARRYFRALRKATHAKESGADAETQQRANAELERVLEFMTDAGIPAEIPHHVTEEGDGWPL